MAVPAATAAVGGLRAVAASAAVTVEALAVVKTAVAAIAEAGTAAA